MAVQDKWRDYVEPRLNYVRELAEKGATNAEIAKALNIAESSFYKFKNEHPELNMALMEGRKSVAVEIKRALLKKALGFSYTEKKRTLKKTDDHISIIEEEYEKYHAPSEAAAAMILRNIDENWRDKDSISIGLKEREVALKEKVAAANNFFEI